MDIEKLNTYVIISNAQIDEEIQMQMSMSRSSNSEIQNAGKFGSAHVLEQYLERYMQDYKKHN